MSVETGSPSDPPLSPHRVAHYRARDRKKAASRSARGEIRSTGTPLLEHVRYFRNLSRPYRPTPLRLDNDAISLVVPTVRDKYECVVARNFSSHVTRTMKMIQRGSKKKTSMYKKSLDKIQSATFTCLILISQVKLQNLTYRAPDVLTGHTNV